MRIFSCFHDKELQGHISAKLMSVFKCFKLLASRCFQDAVYHSLCIVLSLYHVMERDRNIVSLLEVPQRLRAVKLGMAETIIK